MKYNFNEAKLSEIFCRETFKRIASLINTSTTFTIIGMPAVGVSLFLKYLATKNIAYFIHVDTYALSSLTRHNLYILLLKALGGIKIPKTEQEILEECKKRLEFLTKKHDKVVIVFNRFDQLKKEFDQSFFGNLRILRHGFGDKVVMIFSANKPYSETSPKAIAGGNLDVFSKYFYFSPYGKKDLLKLLALHSSELKPSKTSLQKSVFLCGGHFQLLQLLLKPERAENPLLDPFIKLLLKDLYEYLNYAQRKMIQKIAQGKLINNLDEYLVKVGMVLNQGEKYALFSPLFAEYVRSNISLKLPLKEARLFKLLKRNIERIVSKDLIFEEVWQNDIENATDWALDALIYRLRRNPAFISKGYIIENSKKVGYMLVKN